jgi:hypothetical protein
MRSDKRVQRDPFQPADGHVLAFIFADLAAFRMRTGGFIRCAAGFA